MDFIKNILSNFQPAHYQAPAAPAATPTPVIAGVPAEYAPTVVQASQHTGYPTTMIANHLASENGGNWDPKLKGRADPSDFGISQMNPVAVKDITANANGHDYFKENWGHDFNPSDGHDQILAAATYLNYLKQFGLPAAGIKNPTPQQVFTSYNTGAQGYAQSLNGNKAKVQRARTYQTLLANHGDSF